MTSIYPPIEPSATGLLDVGDGHRIYWETCGNHAGKPALVLHGGPGSGCTPGSRRPFDPAKYRIVLFDQRGCGRSVPHAAGSEVDLAKNTTAHLLRDIEALRTLLCIDRWLVFGGSWGSTLALAYAERHPDRVTEVVLAGVTTTSRDEVAWITAGVGRFFPEAYDRFRAGVPEAGANDVIGAYHARLMDPDPAIHAKAARDWCDWEMAIVDVHTDHVPSPRYERAEFRLAFARLVTHYFGHAGFLEDGALVDGVRSLGGIPCVMIHGRLDLTCPLSTPWALAKAWPGSELIVVGGAGHEARDPGMTETLVAVLDRFRPA